jgi:hypothetical protein
VLGTARFDPWQTHMIGINAIGIDHRLSFHLVGDDLAFVDQAVSLGPADAALLQRVCTENLIRVDAVTESPKLAE